MRLLTLFETITLLEAAKDRYAEPFQSLLPIGQAINKEHEMSTEINEEITWAMRVLKKQDKIVWYLRLYKVALMLRLIDMGASAMDNQMFETLRRGYFKLIKQMTGKMGIDQSTLERTSQQATSTDFRRRMEHFMSLGLPSLENYVFSWQTPDQIIRDWTPVEMAWQEKAEQVIDIDREDVETVIEYPDGSEWIDLQKPYCDIEGRAMGHCGNAADARDDDTLLSYRTIEKTDKGDMWKPRLTFVLNTRTGLLGEMKGRANNKPDSKYHNVIMDILKHERVKGIKGGGYDPKNNFAMEDLPEDVAEELIAEKPGLATIKHDYKKRGMTLQLLSRMSEMWSETGEDLPEYDEGKKVFKYDFAMKLPRVVKHYAGDQAEWIMEHLSGDKFIETYGENMPTEDLWDEIPSRTQAEVGQWLERNHEAVIEEWKEQNDTDFDPTDSSNIWDVMEWGGLTELDDALGRGMEDGHRHGTEAAMYESMKDWLEEVPNEEDFDLSIKPGLYDPDEHQQLHIWEADMVKIVSDYLDHVIDQGSLPDALEMQHLEAPYNGWEGYDETAAVENAEEYISEFMR